MCWLKFLRWYVSDNNAVTQDVLRPAVRLNMVMPCCWNQQLSPVVEKKERNVVFFYKKKHFTKGKL